MDGIYIVHAAGGEIRQVVRQGSVSVMYYITAVGWVGCGWWVWVVEGEVEVEVG